ncbi:hypothetical protein [Streptomyces sp. NPDC059819]|uniref:hypothetical protein n=1 Tax=Streptomyces sp. NPDC059819 TaxID=3346963 RepID=UPI00364B678B
MSGDLVVLTPVASPTERRVSRDRLEVLSALLSAPTVPEIFRSELMRFDPFDPVYGWRCRVVDCPAPAAHGGGGLLCTIHR